MIRAVLDTNIIISGLLWRGLPSEIVDASKDGKYRLVISEAILEELGDVLARPKFETKLASIGRTADSLISDGIRLVADVVEPVPGISGIVADPDDDMLIACALGGKADYIVSGDHHLLDLGTYKGIEMITATDFAQKLGI